MVYCTSSTIYRRSKLLYRPEKPSDSVLYSDYIATMIVGSEPGGYCSVIGLLSLREDTDAVMFDKNLDRDPVQCMHDLRLFKVKS